MLDNQKFFRGEYGKIFMKHDYIYFLIRNLLFFTVPEKYRDHFIPDRRK